MAEMLARSAWAVQMLLVALSLLICCSLVWRANLKQSLLLMSLKENNYVNRPIEKVEYYFQNFSNIFTEKGQVTWWHRPFFQALDAQISLCRQRNQHEDPRKTKEHQIVDSFQPRYHSQTLLEASWLLMREDLLRILRGSTNWNESLFSCFLNDS